MADNTTMLSVKVSVRCRPFNAKELEAKSHNCVSVLPGTNQLVVEGTSTDVTSSSNAHQRKSFTFDHSYDQDSSQETLYQESVRPLVEKHLDGFNTTILAYGQTGSGKTYSMGIGADLSQHGAERIGIVPRSAADMFDRLQAMSAEAKPNTFKYEVFCTFLELYNEDLRDLLHSAVPETHAGWGAFPAEPVTPSIRQDVNGSIVWVGVKEEPVHDVEDLIEVLQKGSTNRTVGATDMNATSSRSHAIFSVTLKIKRFITASEVMGAINGTPSQPREDSADASGYWQTTVSKFHFVDLAGSERLTRTKAEGDRKKESISINQGLLALGNVISALGDENRKVSHVPYRDSRLTRMLQDSLGGNSQTLMLACISPSDLNLNETLSTLMYANRARNIKNKVTVNQHLSGGHAAILQEKEKELKYLRALVVQLQEENANLRSGKVPSTAEAAAGILSKPLPLFDLNPVTDTSKPEEMAAKIREYAEVLAAMQVKLSEAEDKIIWYKDTVVNFSIQKSHDADLNLPEGEARLHNYDGDEDELSQIDYVGTDKNVDGNEDSNMLVLRKIEGDIREREAFMARIRHRDAEYDEVHRTLENKISDLYKELNHFSKERDKALGRLQDSKESKKSFAEQSASVRTRYEDQRRNAEAEIRELKQRQEDNYRLQNSYRAQNGALSFNLTMTIEALRKERKQVLRELRRAGFDMINLRNGLDKSKKCLIM